MPSLEKAIINTLWQNIKTGEFINLKGKYDNLIIYKSLKTGLTLTMDTNLFLNNHVIRSN